MTRISKRQLKEMGTFILKSVQLDTVFKSLDGSNAEEKWAGSKGALQVRTMREGHMEVDGNQVRDSQYSRAILTGDS